MDDSLVFVSQKEGVTRFENHSKHNLFVYIKPIKPKRKYTKIILIPSGTFKIFDAIEQEFDLTRVVFSLEKEHEIHSV